MLQYTNEKKENDKTYSIDMIRVHFDIDITKERELLSLNNYLTVVLGADLFTNYRFYNYKNLFVADGLKIGLFLNGANREQNNTGFIEFNPNKQHNIFINLKPYLKLVTYNYRLHTFDVAIDIPQPRANFFLIKGGKDYRFFEKYVASYSTYDITEYLGKRHTNGFCKLYNKQAESQLPLPLTRLEITLDAFEYENLLKNMPDLLQFDGNFSLNVNPTTYQLLIMCYTYNDFSALNYLNRETKTKIKNLLRVDKIELSLHTWRELVAFAKSIVNFD